MINLDDLITYSALREQQSPACAKNPNLPFVIPSAVGASPHQIAEPTSRGILCYTSSLAYTEATSLFRQLGPNFLRRNYPSLSLRVGFRFIC
jgi:hypothetical protein